MISVILPIRNEAAHIQRSLDAVFGQDYPLDHMQVLVADGMSTDGTRLIVERYRAALPPLAPGLCHPPPELWVRLFGWAGALRQPLGGQSR